MTPPTVLISRSDNLGDCVLTLPLAGYLKSTLPGVRVLWLGQPSTEPLVRCSAHVDDFLKLDDVLRSPERLTTAGVTTLLHVYPNAPLAWAARKVQVPQRVGTSHRWYHWPTCTHRVHFSRRRSELHEAQLNFQLLAPLLPQAPGWAQAQPSQALSAYFGLTRLPRLGLSVGNYLRPDRFRLVLHPKSRGSAREWPLSFYRALAQSLPTEKVQILVTGTAEEGTRMRAEDPAFLALPQVTDLTGKLSLEELIALLSNVDGLVACSTGPLHIAAALGKPVLGLYPVIRPMHAGRWGPIGPRAHVLSAPKPTCSDCRGARRCACMEQIGLQTVYEQIMQWVGRSQ